MQGTVQLSGCLVRRAAVAARCNALHAGASLAAADRGTLVIAKCPRICVLMEYKESARVTCTGTVQLGGRLHRRDCRRAAVAARCDALHAG